MPEELERHDPLESGQVEVHRLCEPGEIGDYEDRLVLIAANEGQDLAILRRQELQAPPTEHLGALAERDQALHPPQERIAVVLLGLHVDSFIAVFRIDDDGEIEPLGVGPGKPSITVCTPLHRGPHTVPVPEVEVVPHADLIAVVEDRGAREREQQAVHELDRPAVVSQERRQPPADPEVHASLRVDREQPVHVVAVLVGDHLQRQLVVVSQKQGPLTGLGNRGRLLGDVDDGEAILALDGHEQPWHEGEVEGHVTLVRGAEIGACILRPLVGLGQEHPVREALVDVTPELLEERVGFREVLAARSLSLVEIGHGIQAEPVYTELEPEVDDPQHGASHLGMIVVEVRLMRVEAVPVMGLGDRVPGPVGGLEVFEDDPGFPILLGGVTPHVELAPVIPGLGLTSPPEPRMLVGRVVEHELDDDPETAAVRLTQKGLEVAHRAIRCVNPGIVRGVVAVVLQGRGAEREQPEGGDAEILQVVEPLGQAREIADAIPVAVVERADVELVNDRVFVPEGIVRQPKDVRRHPGHHPGRRATGEPEIPDPALHSTLGAGGIRTSSTSPGGSSQ